VVEGKLAGGYNHKILRVDLSAGSTSVETTDDSFCRKYNGGSGIPASDESDFVSGQVIIVDG
jgi:aldehyde:ferredoxin oxidoreductase